MKTKRIIAYIIGFVAVVTLMFSLFLFLYAFEQIYYERAEQERLIHEWESYLVQLSEDQYDHLALDEIVVKASGSSFQENVQHSPQNEGQIQRDKIRPIGVLSIPSLKVKWPIVEGVTNDRLAKGVGHYPDSADPGEVGNAIYAGHREMGLKKIGELTIGDEIHIETLDGTYIYKITETRIVGNQDRSVYIENDQPILTIITCYPFNYIGSAPERYIVTASLIP